MAYSADDGPEMTDGAHDTPSVQGVLPSWLTKSGWVVVAFGVLGALAAPAFNVHASPAPIVLAFIGLGIALWLCPVYLIVSAVYLARARRLDMRASTSEWVQAALFGLGSATLVGLALAGG